MTTKMAVLGDSLSRMVIRNQLEEGSGQTLFSTILKTRVEKYQLGYIRPNGRIHQLFLGPRSRSELRQMDRQLSQTRTTMLAGTDFIGVFFAALWAVLLAGKLLRGHFWQFVQLNYIRVCSPVTKALLLFAKDEHPIN